MGMLTKTLGDPKRLFSGATARLHAVKLILCAAAVAGLAIARVSWWSPGRTYPLAPILQSLPHLPSWAEAALFIGMLAALALASRAENPRLALRCFVAFAAISCLWDIGRLSPWLYQYMALAFVMSGANWSRPDADNGAILEACAFIVAGIYVYSGLQKLNGSFLHDVFPWLLSGLHLRLPQTPLFIAGALAAAFEAALGFALVLGLEYAAIAGAIAMHAFILLALGPLGRNVNAVIFPWNAAMAALVIALSAGRTAPLPWRSLTRLRTPAAATAVVLFGILPSLSFLGAWDDYLSANLYSGNISTARIVLSPYAAARLQPGVRKYVEVYDRSLVLDLAEWSLGDLKTTPYPQPSAYASVFTSVCGMIGGGRDAMLLIDRKEILLDHRPPRSAFGCPAAEGP